MYAKAPIFQTVQNMNYGRDAEQQAESNKMIEHYKFHHDADTSYLVEETAKLKKKYAKPSQVEQPPPQPQ
jgi:hypothetical protein